MLHYLIAIILLLIYLVAMPIAKARRGVRVFASRKRKMNFTRRKCTKNVFEADYML